MSCPGQGLSVDARGARELYMLVARRNAASKCLEGRVGFADIRTSAFPPSAHFRGSHRCQRHWTDG